MQLFLFAPLLLAPHPQPLPGLLAAFWVLTPPVPTNGRKILVNPPHKAGAEGAEPEETSLNQG